ncbi:tetratricopeptide repeat protein [Sulfurovum sp. bin170]|uniref:tetratricopeptide repeat protein n=1 Tax=Sulfurovum sp. bin170 TaxID=2695268 RepID=UPI0013DFBB89|nr:tetratricopeptide repeat protein [Sulfurovum sp. bin170]NEW60291.1 tetratricopeptide repeat protein [Sulfurovum sp. bin170]
MHSSVNNHDTSTSILSIKEILGIIIVFSFVLYLVFPKDNIDEIIEGKGQNTNLSINYLESMLLYYPDSVKLKMILIRNYDYAGEIEKALALTNKLITEIDDKKILKELYKTEYLLNKEIYFQTKDKILLPKIKEKLYDYFGHAYDENGEIDYMFFFGEATQMDFPDLKYIALVGLMEQRPELADYTFRKEAFELALATGKTQEAYEHLLKLLEYEEIDREIKVYAVALLLEHNEHEKAREIATWLFLNSKDKEVMQIYFNIALHSNSDINATRELVSLYRNSRELKANDIQIILNSLLQVGDTEGAGIFAISLFDTHRDSFDEVATVSAINSLVYSEKLDSALEISLYAYREFNTTKWLDKSIQLSTWLGKMDDVVELNMEGYRVYRGLKYEQYLLDSTTLDNAYEILGEIYKQKLESGDYSMVEKVSEYYNYIGEIPQAEKYFLELFREDNHQNIHRETISFSYKNSHFREGLKLYESYKKRYGVDKALQQESITKLLALKQFKRAYYFSQELEKHDRYDKKLTDLAWIYRDYRYIYDIFWKRERQGELTATNYEKLIYLEKSFEKKGKLAYLYKKVWKKTGRAVFLHSLLSFYIENRELERFKSLIESLSSKEKKSLEKDINYNILLANYYMQTSKNCFGNGEFTPEQRRQSLPIPSYSRNLIKKAKKSFIHALKLDRQNASTHQAYLWFLIDNQLSNALKKEITLLRKNPKLQAQVGFASVVGSLMLQQTDLALRWLKPLLKSSDNIEYQVVYADILQLQDREAGASKIRLKLFKRLNQMVKKSPKLLKDKAFARVYLRMVLFYETPYEKKAIYFKRFKSLFKEKDFAEIEISWYAYNQSDDKAKYLTYKSKLDIPWLNLYLAMSRDNKRLKQKLLQNDKSILAFRDRVIASIDIGDRAGAYTLAFKGLEDNSRDTDLYKIFDEMINSDYPKGELSSKYKNLSPNISLIENQISYRWQLYKGLESKLAFTQYKYQRNRDRDLQDDTLALSLKNSDKKFLWDFTIAKHSSEEKFVSSKLELEYRLSELSFGIKSKYQNRSRQTPKLQTQAVENSIELKIKKPLSRRVQLAMTYRESQHKKEDMTEIGDSTHIRLGANYLLREGYPDIRFSAYINNNQYENKNGYELLPKDFLELGTQFSIGTTGQNRIQRSWRPFGTVGIAVNDREEIGTSLSFGISGALKGKDSLNLSFDYSKGMDMILSPSYGGHLDYRF